MTEQEADPIDAQEEYDENEDDDFNPDKAVAEEDASSSDEEESAAKAPKQSKKRKADLIEELDSGDEATIKERKRKSKKKEEDAEQAEESAGEGGFVRTRAQRIVEKAERKQRKTATVGEVTIDVDDVWAELNRVPVGRPPPPPPPTAPDGTEADAQQDKENQPADDDLITIKRRIEYAGEVTEVEATVPRNSKEAQQYLKQRRPAEPNPASKLRRPLKRPSLFEPNPTASIKGVPLDNPLLRLRAPSRVDVLIAAKRAQEESRRKAEKMTTVQKSALDWRGYVDQEGLREELNEYGKSRKGYLAREDFLGRADLAREEAGRAARLKG